MQIQRKILIIEDEKSLREALADILHVKGFATLEAKNGREGLETGLLTHPNLVLLDLMMPEMDGMTALKEFRKDAWGKKVPIIILTNLSASAKQNDFDAASDASTYYFIKSDWKIHDIVKKIETVINAHIPHE